MVILIEKHDVLVKRDIAIRTPVTMLFWCMVLWVLFHSFTPSHSMVIKEEIMISGTGDCGVLFQTLQDI